MKTKEISITKKEVKNQKTSVLFHLSKKPITSMEAIDKYGATRLSAIIFGLRKEGYNISSIPQKVTNRFGTNVNIVRYKYIPPIENV